MRNFSSTEGSNAGFIEKLIVTAHDKGGYSLPTTEQGRWLFISGGCAQLLFQGGQKAHRRIHLAGDILGQDLLTSPLCRGEFPQIPLTLNLEDIVPVPLRRQQVTIEREGILRDLPVQPRDVPRVGEVQAVP